jgi:hypothetical protein
LPEKFIQFHAGLIPEPDWIEVDADAWRMAIREARGLELGKCARHLLEPSDLMAPLDRERLQQVRQRNLRALPLIQDCLDSGPGDAPGPFTLRPQEGR